MTPLEIEIMLHYYSRGDDYKNLSGPVVKETIEKFVGSGMLKKSSDGWDQYGKAHEITPMGQAYVEALMKIRLPVMQWKVNYPE